MILTGSFISLTTLQMISFCEEYPQSAITHTTLSGRFSPDAIITVAAPMEIPPIIIGRSLPNFSLANSIQDKQSRRSLIPNEQTLPSDSPAPL
jgi:hypothetical protein